MEVPLAAAMSAGPLKRPFHVEEISSAPFELTGVHALLFDDDALAAFINSPAALLPWNGDQSLLIDRYDVRHLLQDLSGIRKRRPATPLSDCTEEELNYERYRDLQGIPPEPQEEGRQSLEELSTSSAKGYQSVPFSYSDKLGERGTESVSNHGSVGYLPPFPVPDILLSKLPPSEKVHQIIAGTAKFVTEHGGQSEVILKVKQGSNPMFGFLNVDHHLHEYYKYLVQHPEVLQQVSRNNAKPLEVTKSAGEGLSLLGFAYGSGDDDDVGAEKSEGSRGVVCPHDKGSTIVTPEAPTTSDGGVVGMDKAGNAVVQATATVNSKAMSLEAKLPPRSLLPLDKKTKLVMGPKDLKQNKKIASQLRSNGIPHQDAAAASSNRISQSKTSSWQSVPTSKDLDYGMSAEAAAAVVLAATRGSRVSKQDPSNHKSSSSSGFSHKNQDAIKQHTTTCGSKIFAATTGLGNADVNLAKAVAEAAAIAASHEADSADTLLTPAEKLKAERLRKARMFAAMIKSGKCVPETATMPSGSEAGLSGSNIVIAVADASSEPSKKKENEPVSALKSDDGHLNSSPVLSPNRKIIQDGKELKSEVHHYDKTSSSKTRSYRKHSNKEQDGTKSSGSDSEEGEHRNKRKSHRGHDCEGKHKHSKGKKRRSHHASSTDTVASSGDESKGDSRRSKKSRRHHHRRKRSHHSHGESGDERRSHKRQDDGSILSADEKHKRKKLREGGCKPSDERAQQSGKVDMPRKTECGDAERLSSNTMLDDRPNYATTTEVPEEIRAKVRAMLLSTL